jgi:RNase P subunit RPR2
VTRYRCRACGNITRFEVVETRTTRSYHHFTVGGDLAIEDPVVVDAHVESVTCRWCGHGRDIEVLEGDGALTPDS